jgi:hypothetical protein
VAVPYQPVEWFEYRGSTEAEMISMATAAAPPIVAAGYAAVRSEWRQTIRGRVLAVQYVRQTSPPAGDRRPMEIVGISQQDCLTTAEEPLAAARRDGYQPVAQAWSQRDGLTVLTITVAAAGRAPTPWSAPTMAAGTGVPVTTPNSSLPTIAGVAWLITAALTGYLALLQLNYATCLTRSGRRDRAPIGASPGGMLWRP